MVFVNREALLCLAKIPFLSPSKSLKQWKPGEALPRAETTDKAALWEHLHHIGWAQTAPSVGC